MRSGPGKNGQEPKKKSTVVSSKKKWTEMNPIRRRMKKCNPSNGQNGQLVHWWLLVHFGPMTGSYCYSRVLCEFLQAPELFTTSLALAIPKAIASAGIEQSQVNFYDSQIKSHWMIQNYTVHWAVYGTFFKSF